LRWRSWTTSESVAVEPFNHSVKRIFLLPILALHWATAILLGIIVPIGFVFLELRTHCLSGGLFDPMPTPWHLILLSMVPIANLFAIIGGQSEAFWPARIAHFLRVPALAIPAFYSVAMGFAQFFALLFSPFSIFAWALSGFSLPSDTSDRLDVETNICTMEVIAPALALVGWCSLRPWQLACAERIAGSTRRALSMASGVFLCALYCAAEIPLIRTFLALRSYARSEAPVAVPAVLLNDQAVVIVSRLAHSRPPFSSDGLLDCEGPVDVFGPTVGMINEWASSTEAWYRLSGHSDWTELLQRIKQERPSADTTPRSWRGLSPWEIWNNSPPPPDEDK
jgi:hypothetical protein